MVGDYNIGNDLHGFLHSGGVYTTIDFPGTNANSAAEINNSGQIVGSHQNPENGYLYSGGVFTPIAVSGRSLPRPRASTTPAKSWASTR